MSRRLALGLIFALAASAAQPQLEPLDEAGFRRLVASAKGRVLLVNFWATYCLPCREEMPHLAALAAKLKARGFILATVSADEPEDEGAAAAFLRTAGAEALPAYLKRARNDEAFINAINRRWSGALPASFIFDRAGRLAHSFFGEVPVSTLEAAVKPLLAPAPTTSARETPASAAP